MASKPRSAACFQMSGFRADRLWAREEQPLAGGMKPLHLVARRQVADVDPVGMLILDGGVDCLARRDQPGDVRRRRSPCGAAAGTSALPMARPMNTSRSSTLCF